MRQAPAARSTAGAQQLSKAVEEVRKRERRIFWGVNVATGRKQAPCTESFAKEAAQRKARRGKPDLQRAEYEESANDLPKITTAVKLHAALQQTEEHSDVTLSQVRRAVTEANKREQPEAVEEERRIRRSIQRGLSGTQPAAYAATLERKRKAREARRPEAEARAAERAQKRARRKADVRVAQWWYDMCRQDEEAARVGDSDDLWYLHERRLDAGCALRIARCPLTSETPRWKWAESAIGPYTFIQKFGSHADWQHESRCPTCARPQTHPTLQVRRERL